MMDPRFPDGRGPGEGDESAPPRILLPAYRYETALQMGWGLFKARYSVLVINALLLFGAGIAMFVVTMGFNLISGFAGQGISFLMSTFLQMPLAAGMYFGAVRLVRGQTVQPEDCLAGFRNYGAAVVAGLPLSLVSAMFGVLGEVLKLGQPNNSAPQPNIILGSCFGMMLMMVTLWILVTRLTFAILVVVDPRWGKKMTGGEAIATSWTITQGHAWSLFALFLVIGLAMAATILLLCVGIVVVGIPLYMAVLGCAYAMVAEPHLAKLASKPEGW